LKVHTSFSKIKSQKEVTKQYLGIKVFLTFFCFVVEGSRSGAGSGSIPLTDGSGSGSRRPKNMWIRWILIRNTATFIFRSSSYACNLDGPCFRGLVLTKILSALEEQSGRSVLQLFDWMGGTSTGQTLVDPDLDPDPDPTL
jgi:hypothetical protein